MSIGQWMGNQLDGESVGWLGRNSPKLIIKGYSKGWKSPHLLQELQCSGWGGGRWWKEAISGERCEGRTDHPVVERLHAQQRVAVLLLLLHHSQLLQLLQLLRLPGEGGRARGGEHVQGVVRWHHRTKGQDRK